MQIKISRLAQLAHKIFEAKSIPSQSIESVVCPMHSEINMSNHARSLGGANTLSRNKDYSKINTESKLYSHDMVLSGKGDKGPTLQLWSRKQLCPLCCLVEF